MQSNISFVPFGIIPLPFLSRLEFRVATFLPKLEWEDVNGSSLENEHRTLELKEIQRPLRWKLRNLRINKVSHLSRVTEPAVCGNTLSQNLASWHQGHVSLRTTKLGIKVGLYGNLWESKTHDRLFPLGCGGCAQAS